MQSFLMSGDIISTRGTCDAIHASLLFIHINSTINMNVLY